MSLRQREKSVLKLRRPGFIHALWWFSDRVVAHTRTYATTSNTNQYILPLIQDVLKYAGDRLLTESLVEFSLILISLPI